MTSARTLVTLSLVLVIGASCAYVDPMVSPKEWDRHANAGAMKVYGEDPTTAGQRVYRALLEQKDLAEFLAKQGEPDQLEIQGMRYGAKSIVLTYTRENPRTIRLEQMRDGTYVPHAPEKLVPKTQPTPVPKLGKPGRKPTRSAAPAESGAPGESAPAATAPDAEPKHPTAEQRVGCPIDPTRPDCQALCTPGAKLEWCR
jgi:hypothetical protein